jgi:hypothetical protein
VIHVEGHHMLIQTWYLCLVMCGTMSYVLSTIPPNSSPCRTMGEQLEEKKYEGFNDLIKQVR